MIKPTTQTSETNTDQVMWSRYANMMKTNSNKGSRKTKH